MNSAGWNFLGQYGGGMGGLYGSGSYLNPITYQGWTQPYLSGFYGGIGLMPYMSGWQAAAFNPNSDKNPQNILGLAGLGSIGGPNLGGYGLGGGFGSNYAMGLQNWNTAGRTAPSSPNIYAVCVAVISMFTMLL